MEQPSSSIFIVLGFLITGGFFPLLAQSKNQFFVSAPLNNPPSSSNPNPSLFAPPPPPPPPPPSPPPPSPPPHSPPPPSPPSPSHPPPPLPSHPHPPLSSSHPPPPLPSHPHPPHSPPPSPKPKHDPKKNITAKAPHPHRSLPLAGHHQNLHHPIDPKPDRKINFGKKIGLLFAGIAGILQVAVVGFLVIKGWQISKLKDRNVNSSS